MKHFLLLLALASAQLALAQPAPPASSAYLQNASFETAGNVESNADHWGVWGEGIARVTDWKPVKIGTAMIAYKHWETKGNDNSGIFQDAALIKAGSKYRFVAPIYLDNPDSGISAKSVELRLESTVNGAQVTVASKTYDLTSTTEPIPYAKWTPLQVTGTAPVDNLRVLVIFTPQQGSRGGAVKVDAVRLEDVK